MDRKTFRKLKASSLLGIGLAIALCQVTEAAPLRWFTAESSATVEVGWWSQLWQQAEQWLGLDGAGGGGWEDKDGNSGGGTSTTIPPGETTNAGGGTDPDG